MQNFSKVLLALCAFTLVIGCSHFKNLEKTFADRYGAEEMVSNNAKIAPVNLITLLDPKKKAEQSEASKEDWSKISDSEKLNRAFEAFYEYDERDPEKLKMRRDRLQDRLLASSNEQCRQFKLMVKLQRDIPADLIPAWTATITAGLGAIFTPVNTVRALSGSAAIVSGIRAEALQTIYTDKTIQVLTAAIDIRRKKKFDQIEQKRARTIQDYTVEAVISDATEYHAACTLIAALEEVSAAIEKQGAAVPASGIAVSPNPLDFGKVKEGESPKKDLKIVNNTTGDISVSIGGLKGNDFTFPGGPDITVTMKPNTSSTLTITFNPRSKGDKADTLTVKPTDPNVPTVWVLLKGTRE